MDYPCDGCGVTLTDCGPIGLACLNPACTYEAERARAFFKQIREAEERAKRDAAFALGVEAAAKLAVEKSAAIRVESDDEDLEDWAANQMRASAGTLEFFAYTLRQDAPTTPLQAALALPEVRELVEAARQLRHAVCGETGFANAVRIVTGLAYPWPALDLADEALCTALAKLEAKT